MNCWPHDWMKTVYPGEPLYAEVFVCQKCGERKTLEWTFTLSKA